MLESKSQVGNADKSHRLSTDQLRGRSVKWVTLEIRWLYSYLCLHNQQREPVPNLTLWTACMCRPVQQSILLLNNHWNIRLKKYIPRAPWLEVSVCDINERHNHNSILGLKLLSLVGVSKVPCDHRERRRLQSHGLSEPELQSWVLLGLPRPMGASRFCLVKTAHCWCDWKQNVCHGSTELGCT